MKDQLELTQQEERNVDILTVEVLGTGTLVILVFNTCDLFRGVQSLYKEPSVMERAEDDEPPLTTGSRKGKGCSLGGFG